MPARSALTLATVVAALLVAAPAHAAKSCDAPGRAWERATPEEAGMDPRKVQAGLDSATGQISYAVRVYRHGCLVGEDRLAPLNRDAQYESFSMAKSVTSLVFGRAMTLGLISPDDPVGALRPEADAAHGAITMRDLLTMSSGLHWNGLRDYNLFTMPDRVRDALTTDLEHAPGTYYEYAQSPVTLLGEAIGRAVGEDMMDFAQRELMNPLGIPADAWRWSRDRAGHIGAFYGVGMRPDDFARLGELLRRGGIWDGRRLLSRSYVREAIEPTPTNGCYGWLIWVNAGAPCIGPRITRRPVVDSRALPNMPADMYRFVGAFGQLVAVFPSQGLVIVRTGTYNQNALISPDGAATTTSASGQEQGSTSPSSTRSQTSVSSDRRASRRRSTRTSRTPMPASTPRRSSPRSTRAGSCRTRCPRPARSGRVRRSRSSPGGGCPSAARSRSA